MSIELTILEQARAEYGDAVVNKTLETLGEDGSEQEFMSKLDEVQAMLKNVKGAIDDEAKAKFDKIKGLPNIAVYIQEQIKRIYNTTAVSAMDLQLELKGNPNLNVDLYETDCYAIAMQIEEKFIADAIQTCLQKWVSSDYATDFINAYFVDRGVSESDFEQEKTALLRQLPDHLKEENSPDNYKLYKAIEIQYAKHYADSNEAVFSDSDASSAYMAGMMNYREEKVPVQLANAVASDDAEEVIKRKGVAGAAGTVVGKLVKFKYSAAESYEDSMREAMGEYANRYEVDHAAAVEKKAAVKEARQLKRQEVKENLKEKVSNVAPVILPDNDGKSDYEIEQEKRDRCLREYSLAKRNLQENYLRDKAAGLVDEAYMKKYSSDLRKLDANYKRYLHPEDVPGPTVSRAPRTNQTSRRKAPQSYNVSPSIPNWLVLTVVHLLVLIIIALVIGWGRTVLPAIGLVLATMGVLKLNKHEPSAWSTLIAGYAIAVLSLIIV